MSGTGRRMYIHNRARALLAVALGYAALWLSSATAALAGPIGLPAGLAAAALSATTGPFGLATSEVFAGPLRDKWLELARKLDDDRVQIALCDGDREHCVSPVALRFLGIVDQARARDGRARLGEINRAINLAIRPASDLAQYGVDDVWSSPLDTFDRGAGDCEDYAIAKYVALRQAGIAADDLRIVILRDAVHGGDHAVAMARLNSHWLMLDNQRMAMIEDIDARNLRPLFVIDEGGVARYADGPVLANIPASLRAEGPAAKPGGIAIAE
jgi:predicted transglutaminase-like cysteine proteinase